MFNRRLLIHLLVSVAFGSFLANRDRARNLETLEEKKERVSAQLEKLQSSLPDKISNWLSTLSEFQENQKRFNALMSLVSLWRKRN